MTERARNVLLLGADYGLFLVGLAFASQATILPAFAAWLGAPNVAIGAIPAVMTLGWFLPSLFAAGHTEALARKLPFIRRWTGWERVPYLVLALFAFFVADRAPGLTLAVLLAMLLVSTGVGGLLMPAWMDLIGRAVPTATRGRFFALWSLAAGVVSFGASFVVAAVLARVPAPASYGICFLAASAFLGLSWLALVFVREPAGGAAAEPVGLRTYLARVPGLLRRDRNLSWFLASRAFALAGTMAAGFYTVYALRAWDAPAAKAGVFTALLVAGHALGTLTLGWVGDHAGHRLVLLVGMAATAAANVVALLAPTLTAFEAVFVLTGLQTAAINVSALNVLLEFAPTPAERPTYIGLGTTSMAPVAFAAPLVAGLLADAFGFRVVFVVALVTGMAGLVMLATRVRDPRGIAGTRAVEEAPA
ncbi:MAG TPA: MFS transporter [Methylomirabilota bacterium]